MASPCPLVPFSSNHSPVHSPLRLHCSCWQIPQCTQAMFCILGYSARHPPAPSLQQPKDALLLFKIWRCRAGKRPERVDPLQATHSNGTDTRILTRFLHCTGGDRNFWCHLSEHGSVFQQLEKSWNVPEPHFKYCLHCSWAGQYRNSSRSKSTDTEGSATQWSASCPLFFQTWPHSHLT